MKRLSMPTLLALCLGIVACGNNDKSNLPVTEHAEVTSSKNTTSLADEVQLEHDDFVKKSQLEIEALNKDMAELKKKLEKKSGETKVKLDEQFKKLEQQSKALEQRLAELKAELKTETKEQWQVLKEGVAVAISTLKKSIKIIKDGLTS